MKIRRRAVARVLAAALNAPIAAVPLLVYLDRTSGPERVDYAEAQPQAALSWPEPLVAPPGVALDDLMSLR